ncbi:MAG: 2'-5' RNA ligase family protein [Synechococcus sp.]|nr:2'-5' RNA ligase family protein [Synechococcus sp.]
MGQHLYFVALLLPPDLGAIASGWQHYCARTFQTQKALNSPPHITLQPPFKFPAKKIDHLHYFLSTFTQTQTPFPIHLTGFNCFAPRVVYIDMAPSPQLLSCQTQLKIAFAEQLHIHDQRYGDRPFCPHVTIAFKDLSRANFDRSWAFFQDRPLHHVFLGTGLTLLRHNGRHWQAGLNFPFPHST